MQLKLVCSGLVALARSRPTAFLEITSSGIRKYPLQVVSPRWGRSETLPFGACRPHRPEADLPKVNYGSGASA
jgi:hypothetical protein